MLTDKQMEELDPMILNLGKNIWRVAAFTAARYLSEHDLEVDNELFIPALSKKIVEILPGCLDDATKAYLEGNMLEAFAPFRDKVIGAAIEVAQQCGKPKPVNADKEA